MVRLVVALVVTSIATCGFTGRAVAQEGCNTDLTGDGITDVMDMSRFELCTAMPSASACVGSNLDVNVDDMVDACDLEYIRCAVARVAGPDECCTRPCDPACTADTTEDGSVSSADAARVLRCLVGDPAVDCTTSDLSGDGVIDCYDIDAFLCAAVPATATPECCTNTECRCICNTFIDGDFVLDAGDASAVDACIGAPVAGACALADVDCDGAITPCDRAIVEVAVRDGFDPMYCQTVECGACRVPSGECEYTAATDCTFADFIPGDTCDEMPPPPPPPGPSQSIRFAGGGGCSGAPGPVTTSLGTLLSLSIVLVWIRRR